ncbi:cutinase, partial [Streptomyces virginiae]
DLITAGGLPALMAQLDPGANSRRIDQWVDFYGSQVHTDYTRYDVDGAGNSATSWLHGWLAGKA